MYFPVKDEADFDVRPEQRGKKYFSTVTGRGVITSPKWHYYWEVIANPRPLDDKLYNNSRQDLYDKLPNNSRQGVFLQSRAVSCKSSCRMIGARTTINNVIIGVDLCVSWWESLSILCWIEQKSVRFCRHLPLLRTTTKYSNRALVWRLRNLGEAWGTKSRIHADDHIIRYDEHDAYPVVAWGMSRVLRLTCFPCFWLDVVSQIIKREERSVSRISPPSLVLLFDKPCTPGKTRHCVRRRMCCRYDI